MLETQHRPNRPPRAAERSSPREIDYLRHPSAAHSRQPRIDLVAVQVVGPIRCRYVAGRV